MTATTKTLKMGSLGDRFAELSVVILTIVALALGWVLKSSVENRALAFNSGDISALTPAGWLVDTNNGNEVLHVTDRTTAGYGTTYLIDQEPVPTDTQPAQVISLLTLQRGHDLTAYRVLKQQKVLVHGREAYQVEYVYVESAANAAQAQLPAIVHGLDYVFLKSGTAVIVSYRADQSNFETDLARFNRFLVSVQF